jgi:hypothetical protein
MKGFVGCVCIDPHFLDLGTNWMRMIRLTPRAAYPGERAPGTDCIAGWVDPKAGLDDVEKRKHLTLPELEL